MREPRRAPGALVAGGRGKNRVIFSDLGLISKLASVLAVGGEHGRQLRGQAVVRRRKLGEWHLTMGKLVPQIRYWSPRARSSTCAIVEGSIGIAQAARSGVLVT